MSDSDLSSLSGDFQHRFFIDELCAQFEKDWDFESQYRLIEEMLVRCPEELREELLAELVSIECEFVSRGGSEPDSAQYLARFPNQSGAIQDGFSSWIALTRPPARLLQAMPRRIGEYQLIREIGRGGTGVVYEAIQDGLTRRVALKALLMSPTHFPNRRARFELEAKAAARLSHEHIATVFDSGDEDGIFYYAMQLIDGKSLSEVIASDSGSHAQPRLVPRFCAKVVRDAANALQYAHSKDVLHRDVKPSNLLLDDSNHVYVVDFGLAKLKDADPDLTTTGDVVGTLRYLAPEAFEGTRDERADVYGLGLTLYEMLTFQPAFGETDRTKLMKQVTQHEVQFPSEYRACVPADLQTITLKALELDPADRYQSARDMADDLQRFLSTKPIRARRASGWERVLKWTRRNRVAAVLSSLLLLLTLIAAPSVAWYRASAKSARAEAALERVESERAKGLAAVETAKVAAVTEAKNQAAYAMFIRNLEAQIQRGLYADARELMDRAERRVAEAKDANTEKSSMFEDAEGRDRRGWEWSYFKRSLDNSKVLWQAYRANDPNSPVAAIESIAISPDDRCVATIRESVIDQEGAHHYGDVVIWDLQTGERLRTISSEEAITGCDFSPDGSLLATISLELPAPVSLNGFVRIWRVATGELIHEIELKEPFDSRISPKPTDVHQFLAKVQFDESGDFLVTSSPLTVYRTKDWKQLWSVPGYLGAVCPGGKVINSKTGVQQLHDLATGEAIGKPAKKGLPYEFILAGDDSTLSSMYRDGNYFQTWALSGDELTSETETWIQKATGIMLTPDGKGVIRFDPSGEIQHYQWRDGKRRRLIRRMLGHRTSVRHGVFTHDRTQLVTSDSLGWVRVWDLNEPSNLERSFEATLKGGHAVESIAFSASGKRLYYADSSYRKTSKLGAAGWFDVEGTAEKHRHFATTHHIVWPRFDFAYSPSGNLFAAPAQEEERPDEQAILFFANSGKIGIWSTDSGELIDAIELGSRYITSLCWSDDERKLAIATVEMPPSGDTTVPFEPDGSSIAIVRVGSDGTVAAESEQTVAWHNVDTVIASGAICFGPKSERLAISCPEGTYLLDLAQGKTTQVSASPTTNSSVDIDPGGQRLAVSSMHEEIVRLYDLTTDQPPIEIDCPRAVSAVQFSPDGTRLGIVGYDNLIYLCDAKSGHRLITLNGQARKDPRAGFSPKVIFSPDGRRIATNALNRRITVWEAEPMPKRPAELR